MNVEGQDPVPRSTLATASLPQLTVLDDVFDNVLAP